MSRMEVFWLLPPASSGAQSESESLSYVDPEGFALLRTHFICGSQSRLHSQLMQPSQLPARNLDNRAADADDKVKNSWSAR